MSMKSWTQQKFKFKSYVINVSYEFKVRENVELINLLTKNYII